MSLIHNNIYQGDVLSVLKTFEDESIDMCCTSPPYFGLRNYDMDGQIGLEGSPEEYTQKLVEVFREVRRVLKNDGTLWLNLGDSYAGSWGNYSGQNRGKGMQRAIITGSLAPQKAYDGLEKFRPPASRKMEGIKDKDLIGIPWKVAIALREDGCIDFKALRTIERVRNEIYNAYEDGVIPDKVLVTLEKLNTEYREAKGDSWYLRQDIIWAKTNGLPESIKDRCTKSHEYVFLLSKSQRYYFDYMAISEEAKYAEQHANKKTSWGKKKLTTNKANIEQYQKLGLENNHTCLTGGRKNKRSVWTIPTKPFRGAHFAVFPEALVEPMILAGSKKDGVVLDVFMGSGTTGVVAQRFGRNYVGIELNPEYIELANKRIVDART